MNEVNTITDGLNTLLASYTEPCTGDCDHSQCPLLRKLHALRIKAALEKARLTVSPIVNGELRGEQIGNLMNMRLDMAAPRVTGETTVEWMPIESAPRDGTEVLVTNYSVPGGFYSVTFAQWVASRGVWWGRGHLPEYPTYWQPVPAPPRTATEGG